MRKKKMRKMFIEIMDERFQDYRGTELWIKVHQNEDLIGTLTKTYESVGPTLNMILAHPALKNLAGRGL